MNRAPIKPAITRKGQPYVDEPVMVRPRLMSELEYAVGRCFNNAEVMARRTQQPIQVAWQQVVLTWR